MSFLNINNMVKLFVVFVTVLSLAIKPDAGASMHNPFFCYATDTIRSMTNMHATITSYEAIRRFNFTTVNPYISTCTPSRLWYLGRYTTRLPYLWTMQAMIDFAESSVQSDIISNYEAGRTTLCQPDFENIRDFTMESDFGAHFNLENAGFVTEAGEVQMQNIARRFQQTFPNILTETYSPDRFHFRHTDTEQTYTSIRAFARSIFGDAGSENVIYEDVPDVDWFLRPFDFCPAFIEDVSDYAARRNAFRQGPEIAEMMEQVNRKLGFYTSNQLDFDQILTMWNWCRFKVASTFELSGSETGAHCPWCAPFSVAHHLLFEYYEDLDHFYFSGYGFRNQRLLENLNCGVMQDLLTHMQSDNNADFARIFMTYTEEIQSMLVLLGSFRDAWPIHEHNFAQQLTRHWLTSLITPFGANLVVVRFDCDDGDHDLVFLLNERPLLVPGCDQHACKLSVIVSRFQRFADANCEATFCSND